MLELGPRALQALQHLLFFAIAAFEIDRALAHAFFEFGFRGECLAVQGLARGDVDNGGDHQRAARVRDRLERDFHGNQRAVGAQGRKIPARSHPARGRVSDVVAERRDVAFAPDFRKQHLEWLSQQPGARVAKQRLGLLVDGHDPAARVGDQHRHRQRLEDVVQLRQHGIGIAGVHRWPSGWICVGGIPSSRVRSWPPEPTGHVGRGAIARVWITCDGSSGSVRWENPRSRARSVMAVLLAESMDVM